VKKGPMYAVMVKTGLIAQHFLVGGDWGPENERHSHRYVLELQVEGPVLNEHGYLVDIVELEAQTERIKAYYRDKVLNELPEFSGLNPSLEHFARILCQSLGAMIGAPNLTALTVRVWENEVAAASYRQEL
jgi:6-pyruvoyltetrahydropterin/6-carboxytetrahydropterin synthase